MVRAKDLGPFPEMLYNVENKVKQFINSLAVDPSFKDQGVPACVDDFLAGVSTFRELKRTNRLPPNLTVISAKAAPSTSKKETPVKKVRIAFEFNLLRLADFLQESGSSKRARSVSLGPIEVLSDGEDQLVVEDVDMEDATKSVRHLPYF
jgi:hypothetical protein